ncbi:MAG TPA: HigA family addiction module antitoxin [Longimicrobiales bacterium]
MVRVPTHRPPTHPGEMLLEEFLKPLGMTQTELAERIGVPFQRVNSLVNGKRGITPDTALRLSRAFGTSAGFWTNHQLRWDLFHAERAAGEALDRIDPVPRDDLARAG